MKRWQAARRPLGIGLILALAAGICWSIGVFSTLSLRLSDRLFLAMPSDPRIVLVTIDESSLQQLGRWPWPRTTHANIVKALREANVRTMAYDVNFSEPTSDDAVLADEFSQTNRVVLPIERTVSQEIVPTPLIAHAVSSTGYTTVRLDRDGVVRRVPVTQTLNDGRVVSSFAYEVARLDQPTSLPSKIPQDRQGNLIIHYPDAPNKAFTQISVAELLRGENATKEKLRDAVVFVGATARDLHDEQAVPTSFGTLMSGVEIHASIFYTLTHQAWLVPAPWWVEWTYLVFIALLLSLSVPLLRPRVSGIVAICGVIAWIILGFVAFDHGSITDLLWPVLLTIFLYGALLLERWLTTEQRRHELHTILSRYLSPSVAESVLRDPSLLALGGRRRTMTMLFSDIRGFTSVSETMSPEELIRVLNVYLGEMTDLVFQQEGVLDKYIGDAVMAFWNAPFDQPDHAIRAVKTALLMQQKLTKLNQSGVFPKGLTVAIGVGLNTGDVVVGNVGSERRFDYTVIGDQVNLASRVEGLTKEYGVAILITENTRQATGDAFLVRQLDRVAVKGKKTGVLIYEVMATEEETTAEQRMYVETYEKILQLYFARNFAEAKTQAELFLAEYPSDVAMKVLMEHVKYYEEHPPTAEWDGSWIMTKK